MKYLKKKTTSILLAIIMLVSMLPMTAFAASYDEVITITVDENGLIATDSNGEYPDGVELVGNTYRFAYGYSFIVNGNLRQTSDIECISNGGEILSRDFSIKVINKGIIAGGTYSGKSVDNAARIWGGTFNAPVINLVGEVAGEVSFRMVRLIHLLPTVVAPSQVEPLTAKFSTWAARLQKESMPPLPKPAILP